MASHEDDGFREIQLNGKQLVFLFMAATVVSVVIFLCGVLVGRGVRAERAAEVQTAVFNESPTPTAPNTTSAVPPASGADPTTAAPPPAVTEEPSAKLQEPPAAEEPPVAVERNRAAAPPAPVASAQPVSEAAPPPARKPEPKPGAALPAAAAPAAAPATDAPRTGYAVQVAAVDARGEADAMARRLSSKGYAAYVEQQKSNGMYRIRVGTFRTRREAQVVADRLKKEEKFKPWVTR